MADGGPPRLRTRFDLIGWYDRVRDEGRPVAWCSAFAPAEALLALGVVPVYPENHAAMLGALSPKRDPSAPYSTPAIAAARAAGHDQPHLCSYAQADIGVLLGADSPIGRLPPPDLFYACDSQCAVVARWGERVRGICGASGRDVPHFVLHAPPLRGERHPAAELERFAADLRGHLERLGARFGLVWDEYRLAAVVAESDRANRLWQECLELGKKRPAPWTSFDAFQAMAPIVIARGDPACTDFYRALKAELEARVAAGTAAVPGEARRLLWDAIPVWPRKNWFAARLAERRVAVVASTYTHSWWFRFDPGQAFASLVERYAWNTMNRTGAWFTDWTLGLVRDYAADGVLSHWNRSCGIWNSFVKRARPGLARAGVPQLLVTADMVDASAFDEIAVLEQLDTFCRRLEAA